MARNSTPAVSSYEPRNDDRATDRAPRSKADKMNWEGLIQDEPNGKQFTAQTANGTAHWQGTGHNYDYEWSRPSAPVGPTRPRGRSNRTGE